MEPSLIIYGLIMIVLLLILTKEVVRLRKLSEEYKKAKDIVKDVILSFNSQLESDEKRINEIDKKITSIIEEREEASMKLKEFVEKKVDSIKDLDDFLAFKSQNRQEINSINKSLKVLEERWETIETRLQDFYGRKAREYRDFEGSAIPISSDSVLEPLNETEIDVLRFLSEEGEKNALHIRDRFNLSREHSSRLLKRLYDSGYLERRTSGRPYLYGIKKEMKNILDKL